MQNPSQKKQKPKAQTTNGDDPLWYKDALIYELHIKAFYDSNGDGIGDFTGLLQKLDYLQDLGVTAIWLLPFYPSPLRDDGYDIADYYTINPSYGDIKVFKKFIKEAHKRDLKVITELVINHTSDQHPWFQRARRAAAGSPERDFYVWSDDPNKYSDVRIIFTDTEPSNWSWDPVAKSYYWHRFFSHQPDLNYDNPQVQKEVFKVLDYWLKMGVDGFRLDAVPYLFEREGTNCENLPETHKFLKKLRKHVDENFENKLLLAEANMWPEDSVAYFGNGDECHMNYHFPIMPRMFMAVKMEDRYPITDIIDQTPDIPDSCQWAIFLRNHDELTLEMVTDEERDYMYKVYTKDAQAKINVGIRHRLAPLLENNRSKMELMNVLLFSLPGTPVIYYGDELGMGDNYYLGDRDGVRTPMQWDANKNAGFSAANPHKLYLPVIIDPEYRYEAVNVEAQQMNPSSLLWWMKRIIAMRKKYKAFGRGSIEFLSPSNAKVIAYTRRHEDETILVLANLSRYPQAAELELRDFEDWHPVEMFSQNQFPKIGKSPYLFTMGPHGYYWFLLEKETDDQGERAALPTLKVEKFKDLQKEKPLRQLERKVLPSYLKSCRWFGGKARAVQSMSVVAVVEIPNKYVDAAIFIIEVSYNEGLPEMYQLPLALAEKSDATDNLDIPEKGKVAELQMEETEGWLYDAVYNEQFRNVLFHFIQTQKKVKYKGGQMESYHAANDLPQLEEESRSRVLNAEQSNTSIIYTQDYFLKIYRKLDSALNPDLEITRFLSEKARFEHSPQFAGALELSGRGRQNMVLAMLQKMVANQGDAWEYFKDVLHRYFERALSQSETQGAPAGDLTQPLDYDELDDTTQELLGSAAPQMVALLGQRTAEMHRALASNESDDEDFKPEAFSLHYQRSLYSSLQSLTRSTFDNLKKNLKKLPDEMKEEAETVLGRRGEILDRFKNIFDHKIDTLKIRNHGDYHLGQVLWTGKDFVIIDFEGEPARAFSERRLKRSPLRDVAGMLRSFHYAAFGLMLENHPDKPAAEEWAARWFNIVGRLFLQSYREHAQGGGFLPDDEADFKLLLDTFLLEKAVYELNYELNNRPTWTKIPLRGIQSILENHNG